MAAIEIDGGSSGSTCAAGAITASIEPVGMLCIRRPRAATARSASSSENTSAMQAETNSPILWPSDAAGRNAEAHPQFR